MREDTVVSTLGLGEWEVLDDDGLSGQPHCARRADSLIKAEQLALHLGISEDAVYRAVHQKRMPHYRFGRFYRFDLDEVLAWMRSGCVANEW